MTVAKRQIRVDGDVAYVPLTKGYVAIVDAADVHLIKAWNWHAFVGRGGKVYARRNTQVEGKWVAILMHRSLAGDDASLQVDHKDGDGLNNRRQNLRHATHQQNVWNVGVRADNSSGFKGVHWSSEARKWRAAITVNGKMRYLGVFDTVEEAASVYADAAKHIHGQFAHQCVMGAA